MSVQIVNNQIQDGTIQNGKIANGTITQAKLNISGQTFDFSGGDLQVAASPSGNSSAVSKSYVDGLVGSGVYWKEPAQVASTANITLSNPGTSTFDGISISSGARVLIRAQSSDSANGVYIFNGSSSAMTRAQDVDDADAINGMAIFVTDGNTYSDQAFVQTETVANLGTDDVTYVRFSGLGQVSAGTALSASGDTLNVNIDDSSIEVNGSDQLQVKASGITDAMLAGSISAAKLAGSIPDSKLNQIVTANKVAGASVQLAGSGGLENSSGLKISDAGVSNDMLAGSIAASKLAGSIPDSKLSQITTADKVAGAAVQLNGSGGLEDATGLKISNAGVTNAMLAGSIADSKLNQLTSSDKVAGSAVQLAGSGGLEDSSGLKISDTGVTNAMLAGSIADAKLSQITTADKVAGSAVQLNGTSLEDSSGLRVKAGGVTNAMLAGSVQVTKLLIAPYAEQFSGNGNDTAFNLANELPTNWDVILVFRNGVFIKQVANSPSGVDQFMVSTNGGTSTVTLGSAPSNADTILVYYFTEA